MAEDAISSLRVKIGADLSELQSELGKIPGLMAEAISGFSSAAQGFTSTTDEMEAQLRSLQGEASATTPKIDSVAGATEKAGSSAQGAAPHFEHLKDSVHESAAGFVELLEKAGLALGVFELLKETLGAFSEIQNVTTSFGILAGSAETAAAAVEDLKGMSDKLAISEETMLSVAQRLAPQFGVGTEGMKQALKAAADAAAATGRSFDTVAGSIERVALTGQVGARQLVALGVSMRDIAETMGVTVSEAEALMKKGGLEATQQVQVLIDTIERRFPGAAEAIAGNLSGQFQQIKNEFHDLAEDIGKALAPVATDIMTQIRGGVIPAIKEMVEWFSKLPEPVQKATIEITALAVALKFTGVLGTLGAIGEALGVITTGLAALAIAGTAGTVWLGKKIWEDWNKNLQEAKDIISGVTPEMRANAAAIDSMMSAADKAGGIFKQFGLALPPVVDATQKHAIAVGILKERLEEARKSITELTAQQGAGFAVEDQLTAARKRENDILQQLNPSLRSIFGTTKDSISVTLESQAAVLAEATARQTSLVPAKELEAVTKALQSAEDAIAAATQATYIPVLLDHGTAIANVTAAHARQAIAIQEVRDAEQRLRDARTAEATGAAGPGAITAATNALTEAERKLKDETAAIARANKDLHDSDKLLLDIGKQLIADDLALLDARKKLYPATSDISKLTGDYTKALKDAREADLALKQATSDMRAEIASGNNDEQRLIDLDEAARRARDNFRVATKGLDDATAALTERFKINRETAILLKQHNDDWTASMKTAQMAMSDLGMSSGAVLDEIARKSHEDYQIIAASNASAMEKAEALTQDLRDQIAAMEAVGQNTDALKIKLAHLETQIGITKDGWSKAILEMNRAVTQGLSKALDDLIFRTGDVGKAFKDLGEQIVKIFIDEILKRALEPVLKAMDSLVQKTIDWLGSLLGVSTGGAKGTTPPFAGGNIPGLGGSGGGSGPQAPGAAGGLGGAGVSGLINTISEIVTAVGTLTQVVESAVGSREEGTLNSIEQHTKVMSIAIAGISAPWETVKAGQDTLMGKVGDIKNILADTKDFDYVVLHDDLVNLLEAVQNMHVVVDGAAQAGTAVVSQSGTPLVPSGTIIGPTDNSGLTSLDNLQTQLQEARNVLAVLSTQGANSDALLAAQKKVDDILRQIASDPKTVDAINKTKAEIVSITERLIQLTAEQNPASTDAVNKLKVELVNAMNLVTLETKDQTVTSTNDIEEAKAGIVAAMDTLTLLTKEQNPANIEAIYQMKVDIVDAINRLIQMTKDLGTESPGSPPPAPSTPDELMGRPKQPNLSSDPYANLLIPFLVAAIQDMKDYQASVVLPILNSPLHHPPTESPDSMYGPMTRTSAPSPITGNVYLDGHELWSSFVRFLEQSGTPAPSY